MTRIADTLRAIRASNNKALISFIMAYDNGSAKDTLQIMHKLSSLGTNIIELGMPFSDPMADGPTIQAAGQRALKNGATMKGIFSIVKDFRKKDKETPIVLMGYYNPVLNYGNKKFVKSAKAAGVDGLIIVDLPIEEDDELFAVCEKQKIDLIKLVTPTTTTSRLKQILQKARGFIYYVSVAGVTGGKTGSDAQIAKSVAMIRDNTDLPIAIGFGIDSVPKAKKMVKSADAIVVGSALINHLQQSKTKAYDFIKQIANCL